MFILFGYINQNMLNSVLGYYCITSNWSDFDDTTWYVLATVVLYGQCAAVHGC